MDRPRYPHGVPCWLELVGADATTTAAFYAAAFGWEVDDGTARLDGRVVAGIGSPFADEGPARWVTSIAVDDLDEATAAVDAAGGRLRQGPIDSAGLARRAICEDPSGVAFGLWDAASRVGAEAVNVPGTWNWSDLATDDADGAGAFYGSVFGWRAVALPAFGATMWQLPGYADHLDALDPSRADRHDAPGVPEGFGDAVGWLHPPTDDAGPGWVVTFATDDADVVVDRAVSAGGTVVAAAHDLGPTRLAVLADTAGARFTVSAYQPA